MTTIAIVTPEDVFAVSNPYTRKPKRFENLRVSFVAAKTAVEKIHILENELDSSLRWQKRTIEFEELIVKLGRERNVFECNFYDKFVKKYGEDYLIMNQEKYRQQLVRTQEMKDNRKKEKETEKRIENAEGYILTKEEKKLFQTLLIQTGGILKKKTKKNLAPAAAAPTPAAEPTPEPVDNWEDLL
jgi:hypothetical protein